ncbi:MAG: WxL domain-containing protein [Chloroflexi bacterium]|nr:WxL domain-containing protein [Chloroflexota bacterium]OJV89510.1 MAG: hypothetical protein BGO39_36705 [Chloroflexi bacterium 54-19]
MSTFFGKGTLNKLMTSLMVAAIISTVFLASIQHANAATGTVDLSGGDLTLTVPTDFSFSGVTLDGLADKSATGTFTVGVDDPSGTNAGWKLSAILTPLADTNSHTLPAAQILTSNDIAVTDTSGATAATNSISYPYTFPESVATVFYNAAVNTGQGSHSYGVTITQSVPKNSYAGTYSGTLTISLVAGPA